MNMFLDPRCEHYRWDYQWRFVQRRKRLGPFSAIHTRQYVTIMLIMKRQLLTGKKPSISLFRNSGDARPFEFVNKRTFERLKRAIDRGESTKAISRRGLLNAMSKTIRPRPAKGQGAIR